MTSSEYSSEYSDDNQDELVQNETFNQKDKQQNSDNEEHITNDEITSAETNPKDRRKSNEITEEEEENNATLAPEPEIEANFDKLLNNQTPTAEFRERHPLFDAPNIIGEQDQFIQDKKLSSDDEVEPLVAPDQDEEEPIQAKPTSLSNESPFNDDFSPLNPSHLIPDQKSPVQQTKTPKIDPTNIPEWKRFSLPTFPDPDDSSIEAEILSHFDIQILLDAIRAND